MSINSPKDNFETNRQKTVGFKQQTQTQTDNNQLEKEIPPKESENLLLNQPELKRRLTDYTTTLKASTSKLVKKKKRLNEIIIDGKSLGLISEENKVRIKVGKFIENPYFEAFIFNLIGLNSLFLALDEPTLSDKYAQETLSILGNFISSLFLLECVLKIFVMGFIRGKFSYIKDNYNKLDFLIVCISILSWILENSNSGIDISFLKAMRALRALRPLKLVSKNEGMKLVVNSILASITNLLNVFMISILFYFVFGVIGL